jgi:hypothetical protein
MSVLDRLKERISKKEVELGREIQEIKAMER